MHYSLEQIKLIIKALKEPKPWDSSCILEIKSSIKNYKLNNNNHKCCYCFRDFTGEFKYDVDIEHILPKKHYGNCIFDMDNLSVSCKRCNMKIKRDDLSFLTECLLSKFGKWKHRYFHSKYYLFVHPNLDDPYEHIEFVNFRINDSNFKKYLPKHGSSKGKFSYDYFKLNELESDSLTMAQGGQVVQPQSELAMGLIGILEKNGLH